jgi:hypothetical protein
MRRSEIIQPQPLTFGGRTFSTPELELIQRICSDFSSLARTEISRTICELLQWKRPNGGLKDHQCRLLIEKMQDMGLVTLPSVRLLGKRGPRIVPVTARSEPQSELVGSVGEFGQLCLQRVEGDHEGHGLWRELIARYHYLGYRVTMGASLRYLVRGGRYPDRVLACLLWTSPAWKMAVRDRWIGWSDEQRRRNLQLIISNGRFLILPWVHVRGLASKILSLCTRQVPGDWEKRYGYRPLLLETLVDAKRFRGICYRAANWIDLGQTQGRGRMDRHHTAHGRAPKHVYIYPLCRDVRQRLQTATPPAFHDSGEELD